MEEHLEEVIEQIKLALSLRIQKEFCFDQFSFSTSLDQKIIVGRRTLGTGFYEVIGTTTVEDIPTFCEREANTPSPTVTRLLQQDNIRSAIRNISRNSWGF